MSRLIPKALLGKTLNKIGDKWNEIFNTLYPYKQVPIYSRLGGNPEDIKKQIEEDVKNTPTTTASLGEVLKSGSGVITAPFLAGLTLPELAGGTIGGSVGGSVGAIASKKLAKASGLNENALNMFGTIGGTIGGLGGFIKGLNVGNKYNPLWSRKKYKGLTDEQYDLITKLKSGKILPEDLTNDLFELLELNPQMEMLPPDIEKRYYAARDVSFGTKNITGARYFNMNPLQVIKQAIKDYNKLPSGGKWMLSSDEALSTDSYPLLLQFFLRHLKDGEINLLRNPDGSIHMQRLNHYGRNPKLHIERGNDIWDRYQNIYGKDIPKFGRLRTTRLTRDKKAGVTKINPLIQELSNAIGEKNVPSMITFRGENYVPAFEALKYQTGGTLSQQRAAENQRHRTLAKHYVLRQTFNLPKAIYHWYKSEPGVGGLPENDYIYKTGVAPVVGLKGAPNPEVVNKIEAIVTGTKAVGPSANVLKTIKNAEALEKGAQGTVKRLTKKNLTSNLEIQNLRQYEAFETPFNKIARKLYMTDDPVKSSNYLRLIENLITRFKNGL